MLDLIHFIKTRCKSCMSDTCSRKPIGSWCTESEGCTKEVSSLDGDKFFHYMVELKPQLKRLAREGKWVEEQWKEMEEFTLYIHDLPPGEHYR
jgi:hypothetical protein